MGDRIAVYPVKVTVGGGDNGATVPPRAKGSIHIKPPIAGRELLKNLRQHNGIMVELCDRDTHADGPFSAYALLRGRVSFRAFARSRASFLRSASRVGCQI